MVNKRDLSFSPSINSSLQSLEVPDFFFHDSDCLSHLPNLTKLTLSAIHCAESIILKALWRTPLISLSLHKQQSEVAKQEPAIVIVEREEGNNRPRFATTLRELMCNEDSTIDQLSQYCWELEKVTCRHPRGILDVNPHLSELIIINCSFDTVVDLSDCCTALEKLTIKFQYDNYDDPVGVVQGSCPNLRSGTFSRVDTKSVIALLSTSKRLENVELLIVREEDQYVQYFNSSRFPKSSCNVKWCEVLDWDQITSLLSNGVQLDGSCVVTSAHSSDNEVPQYFLNNCTSLELGGDVISPTLISSMTSLVTLRLIVNVVDDLQLLLVRLPFLTELNAIVVGDWHGALCFHSPSLRSLVIMLRTFADDDDVRTGRYSIHLPRLEEMYITIIGNISFTGTLLSKLFLNSMQVQLPSLRVFVADGSIEVGNRLICTVGHPRLRQLVLRHMKFESFHLRNVPKLRKLEMEDPPQQQMWLDLPARCRVNIGTSSVTPYSRCDDQDARGLSSAMLRLWAWDNNAIGSPCPLCRQIQPDTDTATGGEESRCGESEAKRRRGQEGCKHGMEFSIFKQTTIPVEVDRVKLRPSRRWITNTSTV